MYCDTYYTTVETHIDRTICHREETKFYFQKTCCDNNQEIALAITSATLFQRYKFTSLTLSISPSLSHAPFQSYFLFPSHSFSFSLILSLPPSPDTSDFYNVTQSRMSDTSSMIVLKCLYTH